MTEQANGEGSLDGRAVNAEENYQKERETEEREAAEIAPRALTLAEYAAIAMTATVTGVIVRQQHVPAAEVMKVLCQTLGVLVGSSFQGTLPEVFKIRNDCREAFVQGIKNSPPPPMPQPAAPQQTRPAPNGG
jgi:hypothetical protein